MGDGLLSVAAAVAANRQPESDEFDFVGRFQLNPRSIILRGGEEWPDFITTFGVQLAGYVGAGSEGAVDGRLYFGAGNSKFEVSLVAGYTHGFFADSVNTNGFSVGGAVEFNPLFFLVNQPFWVAIGYDMRGYDKNSFAPVHMFWAGISIMIDWVWNPARYADPSQTPNA